MASGGHNLLSLIDIYLKLDTDEFSQEIEWFEILVCFDLEKDIPKLERLSTRFVRAKKTLYVSYYSQYPPFEDDHPFGNYVIQETRTRACKRFKQFLQEMRSAIEKLAPRIEKSCDLDCVKLLQRFDQGIQAVPTRDSELLALAEREKQRSDREWRQWESTKLLRPGIAKFVGAPWENGRVADWLSDAMRASKFPSCIREALKQKPSADSLATIRAAASVLIMLGEPFVWPPENYRVDFELAVSQLTDCLLYVEDDSLRTTIMAEIAVLRKRLSSTYKELVPLQIELLKLWYL